MVAWLTEHVTDVVNKLHRRKNGRTSYELAKGKPYRSELAEFGQRVLYRLPGKFRGGGHAGAVAGGHMAGQDAQSR